MATTENKTNDPKEEKAARKTAVFSELEKDLYEKGEVIFHRSNLNDFTTYLTRPENMKRLMEQPTEYQKITQTHIRLYLLTDEELRNRKQSLPYKPEPDRADLRGFIFNPDEIVKLAMFSSHLLDENTFAFGILLPKTEPITSRKGEVLGHRQVWRPVVITSKQMGIPYSLLMENTHKIRYLTVPEEMRLRWELPSIEKYLAGEAEKVDGQSLFRAVRDRYAHYCYYRVEEWYDVNALWDIGTYLHQLFVAYPLKEERGMQGTAKTKTMIVSSYMTLNATDIMINPSEATLFRETEACAPTKNIDEAEKLFTPGKGGGMESDNRVELINASYSKNGTVPRQEKIGKVFVTKWYHVYSPTRISSINGLYGATESRSITQVHTHALDKDERGEREPEADAADTSVVQYQERSLRLDPSKLEGCKRGLLQLRHRNIAKEARPSTLEAPNGDRQDHRPGDAPKDHKVRGTAELAAQDGRNARGIPRLPASRLPVPVDSSRQGQGPHRGHQGKAE